MKAGTIVQIVSISCPSIVYLLNFFDTIKDTTTYRVKIVIKERMIIEWSWKNKIFSIKGEVLSWNEKAIQNGILLLNV